jgi:hypothetical protein
MNVYTLIVLDGFEMQEPHTGAMLRTQITAYERCDRVADLREYVVEERCGVAHLVRSKTIKCDGYFGSTKSPVGRNEAQQAFAIARAWAAGGAKR